MPPKLYSYVGPEHIRASTLGAPAGAIIEGADDLARWLMQAYGAAKKPIKRLTVTFVIDAQGRLRLADQHSEHVACAGHEPVRSAGELTLSDEGRR